MQRTRIKICGLTREEDVRAAVQAGADALGFVFYPASPRYVTRRARRRADGRRCRRSSPRSRCSSTPTVDEVVEVARLAPFALLQFHGDETRGRSARPSPPRSAGPSCACSGCKPDTSAADLLEYEHQYRAASPLFSSLLLDTYVDAYGGAGKVFDWSLIPKELAPRVVLSGGLSVNNATDAVARVRPFAVDISSGVEQQKGIKDARKIAAFIDAVRAADATIESDKSHESST